MIRFVPSFARSHLLPLGAAGALLLGASPLLAQVAGTLDPSFGTGGLALAPGLFYSTDVTTADNERPVVVGRTTNDSEPDMATARFLA